MAAAVPAKEVEVEEVVGIVVEVVLVAASAPVAKVLWREASREVLTEAAKEQRAAVPASWGQHGVPPWAPAVQGSVAVETPALADLVLCLSFQPRLAVAVQALAAAVRAPVLAGPALEATPLSLAAVQAAVVSV